MVEVCRRKEVEAKKYQFQQSVFLSWWIYAAIPKSADAESYSMQDWLKMYGLGEKEEQSAASALKDQQQREKEHKEDLERAYRNVESLGVPNPFKD